MQIFSFSFKHSLNKSLSLNEKRNRNLIATAKRRAKAKKPKEIVVTANVLYLASVFLLCLSFVFFVIGRGTGHIMKYMKCQPRATARTKSTNYVYTYTIVAHTFATFSCTIDS